MDSTLLVIDGKSRPQHLIDLLESAGYCPHYTRGPLKLRELLRKHPIRLILWRDGGGNAALGADLHAICAQYPHIPILHLYGVPATPLPFASADALPSTTPPEQILAAVARILNDGAPTEAWPPSIAQSELAFRHLISRFRGQRGQPPLPAAPFHVPGTSLHPGERAQLAPPKRLRWWQRFRRP